MSTFYQTFPPETTRITLLTVPGLESAVIQEIQSKNLRSIQNIEPMGQGAVSLTTDLETACELTFILQTIDRVLVPLFSVTATRMPLVDEAIRSFDWKKLMSADQTLSVHSVGSNPLFRNSLFLAQKVKDGICDYFRDLNGKRPSVDLFQPDLALFARLNGNELEISWDLAGAPLHRRGYRKYQGQAPLKEHLAAGLLYLIGWQKTEALYDPFCGSGTILWEAFLQGHNIAPGLLRSYHSYERSPLGLGRDLPKKYSKVVTEDPIRIYGSDLDADVIGGARSNQPKNFPFRDIRFSVQPFEKCRPKEENFFLVSNIPYNERTMLSIDPKEMGDYLKSLGAGKAGLLIGNAAYAKQIGLRVKNRYTVPNGGLDCRFITLELYSGSKKTGDI